MYQEAKVLPVQNYERGDTKPSEDLLRNIETALQPDGTAYLWYPLERRLEISGGGVSSLGFSPGHAVPSP
jgi:hypothetical protein